MLCRDATTITRRLVLNWFFVYFDSVAMLDDPRALQGAMRSPMRDPHEALLEPVSGCVNLL